MATVMNVIFMVFYCLSFLVVIIGTSYIVFWMGHSGWWWLLAVALIYLVVEMKITVKTRS